MRNANGTDVPVPLTASSSVRNEAVTELLAQARSLTLALAGASLEVDELDWAFPVPW